MLDEPFGALDAFTREELWCVIRDLHAARKITIVLVTHDLREAVFLADRIFVMSARPGRVLAERVVDIPRPRDLEVTFAPRVRRDRARAARAHREGAAMKTTLAIRLAPWIATIALFVFWEAACRIFKIPPFFLPPPTLVFQAVDRLLAGALQALAVHALLDAGRLRRWRSGSGCCSGSRSAGRARSTPASIR